MQRCSFAVDRRADCQVVLCFQIIFSINWKKEISTGTLIQFLSDCPILYEIGRGNYEDINV